MSKRAEKLTFEQFKTLYQENYGTEGLIIAQFETDCKRGRTVRKPYAHRPILQTVDAWEQTFRAYRETGKIVNYSHENANRTSTNGQAPIDVSQYCCYHVYHYDISSVASLTELQIQTRKQPETSAKTYGEWMRALEEAGKPKAIALPPPAETDSVPSTPQPTGSWNTGRVLRAVISGITTALIPG